MEENRWTRKVFIWDKETTGLWSRDGHALFCKYGFDELFLKNKKSVYTYAQRICAYSKNALKSNGRVIFGLNQKLQTFRVIKSEYATENYVLYNLTKKQRSLCAQLRSGILPMMVETGRYVTLEEEMQTCRMCCLADAEKEFHFISLPHIL